DDFAECAKLISDRVRDAKDNAERQARKIIGAAIQRFAADHTTEMVVSSVPLPNEDMKGRIIGREGRNIRAFEKATGVDVIVDDTPGVIVVSGFDGVRREIARLSMEKLVQDGRIHPARIEEVVEQTKKEMDNLLMETGKQAAFDCGVHNLDPREVELLGRLKFRTSYGQNQLQHVIEVAHLTGIMAGELGLDVQLAKRCGLLHDLGKAMDHEMEGGHPEIGAEMAKRCGECQDVIDAIGGHHLDIPPSIYAVLVSAADAISASRPGARRETLEKYIKRLEQLEAIANSFPGVQQAYAIQAGREVRVIVSPDKLSEEMAQKVCRDIAKQVEKDMTYPGEVRVTLIRESRYVEVAH
ncbi:MAG TPA: ribonuclease Y, partial [Candidatus Brocadiia bacterium]|nr:ribonuclease Y [Candidatus Brocadiia bacterium]